MSQEKSHHGIGRAVDEPWRAIDLHIDFVDIALYDGTTSASSLTIPYDAGIRNPESSSVLFVLWLVLLLKSRLAATPWRPPVDVVSFPLQPKFA